MATDLGFVARCADYFSVVAVTHLGFGGNKRQCAICYAVLLRPLGASSEKLSFLAFNRLS